MIDRGSCERSDAVATTTGYIVNLGVASVIITLLLLQAQGIVGTLSETSKETELEVKGERISAAITEADKLHRMSEDPNGEIPLETFGLISGQLSGYTANVSDAAAGDSGTIHLRPARTTENVSVTIQYNARTEVHGREFSSAEDVKIAYNSTGIHVR